METRAHHILIGFFTVSAIACMMFFVLWLTKTSPTEETDIYNVIFKESVSGLSPGSRVLYSGIYVGTVEKLQIDPDNPGQVIARIRIADTTPVREDTHARLILANITGATEILLSSGSEQSPPLESQNGGIPEIIAEPSDIARLRLRADELLKNISTLVENSNRLLSEENAAHITYTLENLSKSSDTLIDNDQQIRQSLQNLAQVSQETEQLVHEIHLLVRNQGESLMTNGAETMASLHRTSTILERLLRENEQALAGGMEGLNNLGPALEELRKTLASLKGVAQRFEEDPSAYLFSREPVREFQP